MGGRIHAVISSISRFNQPYPQTTGAPLRLKTRPTRNYVDLSPLTECLPLQTSNVRVMRGFRNYTTQSLYLIHSYLSCRFINGTPTVEALNMSYDEDVSSVEAIYKLNQRAQAKLNTGIQYPHYLSTVFGIIEHLIFRA